MPHFPPPTIASAHALALPMRQNSTPITPLHAHALPTNPPSEATRTAVPSPSTTQRFEESRGERLRAAEEDRMGGGEGGVDEDGDAEAARRRERARRLRVQSRRRRYLELHPEYFDSAEVRDANPHLYDRLVRRHQSASAREAEGRARGIIGGLEASLAATQRARETLRAPEADSDSNSDENENENEELGLESRIRDGEVEGLEGGLKRWRGIMEARFVRGRDVGFEYEGVDEWAGYDDLGEEGRRAQEGWFGEEREEFVGVGRPVGETGVQDF